MYNIEAHQFRTYIERKYAYGDNVDISVTCLGELNHLDGCSFVIMHVYTINFKHLEEWKEYLTNLGAVDVFIDVDGTCVHIDASWEKVYTVTNHKTEFEPTWSYGTILTYLLFVCLFVSAIYASTFVNVHPIQILQWIHYVVRNFFA